MKLYFRILEYTPEGKFYLTIGRRAPWDNMHFWMPKIVAKWILKITRRKK